LSIGASDETSQLSNVHVFAQEMHGTIAEQQMRTARMKRVDLGSAFGEVRLGVVGRKVFAVGAIQRARTVAQCLLALLGCVGRSSDRAVECQVGSWPTPAAAVLMIRRGVVFPDLALEIDLRTTSRFSIQNRVR